MKKVYYILGFLTAIFLLVGVAVLAAPQSAGNIFRNITPEADLTYYIGTSTRRWLGLEVGNVTSTEIYVTNDLRFDGEIKPDGDLCSNGQILKKISPGDWDCVNDSGGGEGEWEYVGDNLQNKTATSSDVRVVGKLQASSTAMVGGKLYVSDFIYGGKEDTTRSVIYLYGNNANAQPVQYFFNSANFDTNENYWAIGPADGGNDLLFGASSDIDMMKLSRGGNLLLAGNSTTTYNGYFGTGLGLNSEYINQWSDLNSYIDFTSNWVFNASGQLTPSSTVDVLLPANATTTGTLYVGGYASTTGGLFTQGSSHIGGNLTTDSLNVANGAVIANATGENGAYITGNEIGVYASGNTGAYFSGNTGVYATSNTGVGAYILSATGNGMQVQSGSGTGAIISSDSGDYGLYTYNNTVSKYAIYSQKGLNYFGGNTVFNSNATTTGSSYLGTSVGLSGEYINQWSDLDSYLSVGNPFNQWLDTTSTVEFNGLTSTNATTTTQFNIGNDTDYARFYLFPGFNVPIFEGYSSIADLNGIASLNNFSILEDTKLVNQNPNLLFIRGDGEDNAGIYYNTTTDQLAFVNASGGYAFDNDILGVSDLEILGNTTTTSQLTVGNNTDYLKIYLTDTTNIPVLVGHSGTSDLDVMAAGNSIAALELRQLNNNPSFVFLNWNASDNAAIGYVTTTDAMYFTGATGGYNFDNNVTVDGNATTTEQLTVGNDSNYLKSYLMAGSNIPTLEGYSSAFGTNALATINALVIKEKQSLNTNPTLSFLNYLLSDNASIRYTTTTDAMLFSGADGGYSFDNQVGIATTTPWSGYEEAINGDLLVTGNIVIPDEFGSMSIGTTTSGGLFNVDGNNAFRPVNLSNYIDDAFQTSWNADIYQNGVDSLSASAIQAQLHVTKSTTTNTTISNAIRAEVTIDGTEERYEDTATIYGFYNNINSGLNNGNTYAGYFDNQSGASSTIGLYAYANGQGRAVTSTALYASADSGTNNWAGYFDAGDVNIQNDLYISGNVGIGLTSPATLLEVNGHSSTTQLTVGNDGAYIGGNVGIGGTSAANLTLGSYSELGVASISVGTSDGSDNRVLGLSGGGGETDNDRGGSIWLFGNEQASAPGDIILIAGSAANADISLTTNGGSMILDVDGNVGVGATSPSGLFEISTSTHDNMFVVSNATGNVGIGTASPSEKLHILGPAPANDISGIRIEDFRPHINLLDRSSSADDYQIKVDGNNFVINHDVDGTTFADNYLTILGASGNVGIGTASPDAKLEILSGNPSSPYSGVSVLSGVSNKYTSITVGRTVPEGYFAQAAATNSFLTGTVAGDNVLMSLGKLHLSGSKAIGGGSPAMTITNDNVGIGTASPTSALTLGTDDNEHITDGYLCVENSGGTDCAGTTDGVVYADDFIEHSRPLPEGDALSVIMNMKNKEDGTLDHSSFPSYVSQEVSWEDTYEYEYDEKGATTTETLIPAGSKVNEGVSISSQIKYLIKAVQELYTKVQMSLGWNQDNENRIAELEKENQELKVRMSNLENNIK